MNRTISIIIFIFFFNITFGQQVVISGEYNYGLNIAYDSKTNLINGYYENYTGWDDGTNNPRFSCIFYIEGKVESGKIVIKTYSPTYENENIIEGTLEIVNNKTVKIKLSEEHGGCWNVEHYVDEPVKFELGVQKNWFQIRFVKVEKTYFYKNHNTDKKLKKYLIKGDFVCIEKIENEWAYCSYFGKKISKGWIMLKDLNKL